MLSGVAREHHLRAVAFKELQDVVRPPSCGNPLRGCGPGLRDL